VPVRFHNLANSAPSNSATSSKLRAPKPRSATRRMEAVVPGHRLRPLHKLHAMPELLSVRRLRRGRREADSGAEQRQLQDQLPGLLARLPEAAIMFPKYKAGPINGDIVSDADLQKEKMKVDISALLGGDVYEMLRLRSEKAKSRFSKGARCDKALAERQKCLVKLAAAGDIPARGVDVAAVTRRDRASCRGSRGESASRVAIPDLSQVLARLLEKRARFSCSHLFARRIQRKRLSRA
jgi:hypothetical protein